MFLFLQQEFLEKEVVRQQREKLDLINVHDLPVLRKYVKEKRTLSHKQGV